MISFIDVTTLLRVKNWKSFYDIFMHLCQKYDTKNKSKQVSKFGIKSWLTITYA